MPREVALFGVYMPALTLIFIVTLFVGWGMDRCLTHLGFYQYIWHPMLFRVSLFSCFFTIVALFVYS